MRRRVLKEYNYEICLISIKFSRETVFNGINEVFGGVVT